MRMSEVYWRQVLGVRYWVLGMDWALSAFHMYSFLVRVHCLSFRGALGLAHVFAKRIVDGDVF